MLNNEYPIVSSNLTPGFGIYGTADPYNAALPNNGALNPPGSIWTIPAPAQSGPSVGPTIAGADTNAVKGYGSYLTVKYVLYKSSNNPAMVAGPAPVYYVDGTIATVSGHYVEGLGSGYTCAVAGFLLVNTGTVAGVGVGSAITATILNNSGLGSWVFVAVEGFVPSCYLANGAVGNSLMGAAAADFSTAVCTTINRQIGYVWSAVSNNIGDVLVTCGIF